MTSPGGKEVGRISIKVLPDTSDFRKRLEAQLKAIEDSVRAAVQVDVDLDAAGAKAKMRGLMTELKAQAAGGVDVKVGVDKSLLSRFTELGSSAGGAIGSIGGMGRNLLIVAAVAAIAAPALALIAGVLVGLPALIAAVAIPIAALALGMDGLKEAAKVLAPDFEALKKTMTGAVQEQFTPVFEKLRGIFPTLNAELPKVTQGLADMAGALVNSVTSQAGMDKIRNTISNIGTALTTAAPGIGKFTDGMLGLISSVSDHLPGLSQFFNQFADRFLTWVEKTTKKDWFGNSPLSSAMGSLKESLQGVFDLVVRLGTEGFDLLKDPKMGENIKKVFDGIKTFVTDTLPALNKGFDSIATAVAGISDKWNAIEWGLNPLGKVAENLGTAPGGQGLDVNSSGIDVFMENIRLAKVLMGQLMVQGLTTFTTIRTNAANALSGIWDTVTTAASVAWDSVKSIVATKVAEIGASFGNLGTLLSSAWANLGSVASSAWASVTSAVSTAFTQIVGAVTTGAGQIVSEISTWPGKFVGALGNIGGILVAAGRSMMDGLLSGIRAGLQAVLDFAGTIADKIAAVKGPLPYDMKVLTPAGEALMHGLEDGMDKGFKSVLDRAKGMAGEIGEALVGPGNDLDKQMSGSFDFTDSLNQMVDAGKGFAEANIKQFTSDIGISGGGALTTLADQGIGFLTQSLGKLISGGLGGGTTINVGSVDDALAAKQTIANKKALQYTTR